MTTAQNGTTEGTGANPGSGAAPAGGAAPVTTSTSAGAGGSAEKPAEKKTTTTTEKPAEKPVEKKEKKVATLADDDEDLPEDAELYQLSKKALESRLARHTKRQLRERFGTDDLDSISKDLKELKVLRDEKEETRKAQLSKEERLQEEKKAADARAQAAEEKATKLEDERDIGQVGDRYARLAKDHINPKFLEKRAHREALFSELATDLHTKTGGDATKITNKMVSDFWANYVKENPEFSAKPSTVVEVPVNTGTRQAGPTGTTGNVDGAAAGKTARPGQPNSMTKEEIKKAHGVRW